MTTTDLFHESPFVLTATPEGAACWAGRPDVLRRLQKLQRAFRTRSDSSLDVVWANLGAGKSHLLFHLAHMLRNDSAYDGAVCAVVEMPEQLRNFHELYRRIVPQLPLSDVASRLQEAPVENVLPNLRRAAQVLLQGSTAEKALAVEWMCGNRPHLRELRNATGIGERIEDDQAACDALCGIIGACANARSRTILLIDEFQRIARLGPRQRITVLSNLRSVFSRNPTHFSVVVAIESRAEETAVALLSPQLRTLMGVRPAVSLPEMDEAEALDFVSQRLAWFRPEGYGGGMFAPIGEEAVRAAIEYMAGHTTARLSPREILQVLAELYDEAVDRDVTALPRTDVDGLLEALAWDRDET